MNICSAPAFSAYTNLKVRGAPLMLHKCFSISCEKVLATIVRYPSLGKRKTLTQSAHAAEEGVEIEARLVPLAPVVQAVACNGISSEEA